MGQGPGTCPALRSLRLSGLEDLARPWAFLTRRVLKTFQKVPIYAGPILKRLEDLGRSPKPEGFVKRVSKCSPNGHLLRLYYALIWFRRPYPGLGLLNLP